ncbi:hypothetical protein MA420_000641 [Klebsiella pneumoniae]|nr:hypothetical protein [Klebsiella pneumoniae]
MAKSTITRERLEELAAGQSGFNLRIATLEESQQLARMALDALDSEPVSNFKTRDDYPGWFENKEQKAAAEKAILGNLEEACRAAMLSGGKS